MNEYKVTIMGAGGSGKSALTVRYISQHFVESYDPTIEDAYRKQVSIDNNVCILDILDTAGQEEYSALRDQYLRSSQCFVFVFDVTRRSTLQTVTELHQSLCRALDRDHTRDISIVLVGNKCDLDNERQVIESEAKLVANQIGCSYIEASAKSGVNCDRVFEDAVRIHRRLNEKPNAKSNAPNQLNQNDKSEKKQKKKLRKCSIL